MTLHVDTLLLEQCRYLQQHLARFHVPDELILRVRLELVREADDELVEEERVKVLGEEEDEEPVAHLSLLHQHVHAVLKREKMYQIVGIDGVSFIYCVVATPIHPTLPDDPENRAPVTADRGRGGTIFSRPNGPCTQERRVEKREHKEKHLHSPPPLFSSR